MSIENSRYTLSKNGDNIILTDKRDKKTRILTPDDVDYVIDDNQKLRDVNIIENYFKLKEEPYEPKLITKTADLKKEYREAERQYKAFPQDLVEQFIKRFKLNPRERRILGEIPEESTFKKFTWKTEEQQREMVTAGLPHGAAGRQSHRRAAGADRDEPDARQQTFAVPRPAHQEG